MLLRSCPSMLNLLLLKLIATESCLAFTEQSFSLINGSLCIRAEFVETYTGEASVGSCAFQCGLKQRCQAFTTADGPCQLFVFDACSKSVRDCNCARRGRVLVKRQPRLGPGALCPADYANEQCGVKYKLFNSTGVWAQGKQKCESEAGLTIMADAVDLAEYNHLTQLPSANFDATFWLGGFQTPGSAEPGGGWLWVACGLPVDKQLWISGEPNNFLNKESAVELYRGLSGLLDAFENLTSIRNVICECVSPFD